eukprot:CAMPEP_0176286598 /NCGR_PEP_ID=MMETSP0121_2-20121125/52989_1 /TAXON_ID=160619 /ORGANISM="Kryptoperidinium foliaceum, Strain CCMP 1326" /LENGTH=80 /DNA_ID=CAMNT_0017627161 /DNA_START=393 /DNA_END=633 /DNA_ORIENTATION=+
MGLRSAKPVIRPNSCVAAAPMLQGQPQAVPDLAHAPMAQHIRIDHRAAFSAMSADLVASITASSDASAGFSTSASPHLLP